MSGFFHALIASVGLNPGQILPATRKDGTGDCPVMSGFFHAQAGNQDLETQKLVALGDCPVMSGFFHARDSTKAPVHYVSY